MKVTRKIALGIIALVILVFLFKLVFFGGTPAAGDLVARHSINQWIIDYSSRKGDIPQWYPHLFGGMPSYGGYIYTPSNPVKSLLNPIMLNQGVWYLFYMTIGGIGMFLFLHRRGLTLIPAMFGSLSFALSPYFFGLINAGHPAKLYALCFIPWIMMAVNDIIRTNKWRGSLYLGLASALQLWTKHIQIVYYTWMLIVFVWLWTQISAIVRKKWSLKKEGSQTAILFSSLLIAFLLVSDPYVSIYQFQGQSTRGVKSILEENRPTETSMKWEYSTAWSFHPKETISFLYPYFYGLQNFSNRDKSFAYWGHMTFTQSTHYLGLLVILLSIVGLTRRKPSNLTLAMVVVSFLIIIVGFGKYFPVIFKPLYELAPMFNKFRIPSMIYAILPFTIGVVASQGLENIQDALNHRHSGSLRKLRLWTFGIFGTMAIVSLSFLLFGDSLSSSLNLFRKMGERFPPQQFAIIKNVRLELFQKGAILALFISCSGLATILLGLKKSLKPTTVGILILFISIGDLWIVNQEFLDLKSPSSFSRQFRESAEVKYLLRDKELFRIIPLHNFNTNWYGYFGLSSIGGYRPVKLRTYQDFMDASGLNFLGQSSRIISSSQKYNILTKTKPLLDMLNVKYVISGESVEPLFKRIKDYPNIYMNENVLPKAWFVSNVISVSDQKKSLFNTLSPQFNPSNEAIVVDYNGPDIFSEGEGDVSIKTYGENEIKIESNSNTGRLLVLSENYYAPGWRAYVDESETNIFQANHILRAVYVPEGKHNITFRYNTDIFWISRLISRSSMFLMLLSIVYIYRKKLLDVVRYSRTIKKK